MARRTGADARSPFALPLAIGGGIIATALPVACLMAGWRPGQELAVAVHEELWGRPGVWRLLRGALAYVAMPTMLATAAVVILVALRRSRRTAALLAAGMVLGNISVQAVKHITPLQAAVGSVDPLSGHTGVVVSVCLAALVALPSRSRPRLAPVFAGAQWAVLYGVMLAAWHSFPQVSGSALLSAGWLVAACAFLPPDQLTRDGSAEPGAWRWVAAGAGVMGLAGAGTWWITRMDGPPSLVPIMVTVGVASLGLAVTTTGAAMAAVSPYARRPVSQPAGRQPSDDVTTPT